ncbi:hypothetical protein [Enterococcus sp. DIV0187]|uniref:hypothetical protein n=1 Tax=Enterococcus sp. DIV0187 TaxID=2774644 RepID=UPI003F276CD7
MYKKLQYLYMAIQSIYWLSTVGSVGFVVLVLQKQGFDVVMIGILLTIRAVISVFCCQ